MVKHQELAAAAEAEGLYYVDGCCVDCGKDTTPHTIVKDGDVNGFGMEFTRDITSDLNQRRGILGQEDNVAMEYNVLKMLRYHGGPREATNGGLR